LIVITVRAFVHLDTKAPAFSPARQADAEASATVAASGWPACDTVAHKQRWVISVAQAQPDLATVEHALPPPANAAAATLQQAVRAASAIAVGHAVAVSYDPIRDGRYDFIAVSVEFDVDQTIAGTPPPVITVGAGTLIPGGDCAPIFEPTSATPLLVPPAQAVILLANGRPEDTVGVLRIEGGVMAAGFEVPFAPDIDGMSEQDFIARIQALRGR
jgi:hypothetical protein